MELQDESQERITLADLVPVPLSDPIAVRLRMSGECRLLWAVLEDGIECYLRYGDHPSAVLRELFQEANDWIEAKEGEGLCSFIGICDAFQIDPSYLRRGLRRRLREIRQHQTLVPLKQAAFGPHVGTRAESVSSVHASLFPAALSEGPISLIKVSFETASMHLSVGMACSEERTLQN